MSDPVTKRPKVKTQEKRAAHAVPATPELPHQVILPADVTALLARGEATRQIAHEAAERAFAELVAAIVKLHQVPDGVPFEVQGNDDGTAVVRYGAPAALALVTDAEGAE